MARESHVVEVALSERVTLGTGSNPNHSTLAKGPCAVRIVNTGPSPDSHYFDGIQLRQDSYSQKLYGPPLVSDMVTGRVNCNVTDTAP